MENCLLHPPPHQSQSSCLTPAAQRKGKYSKINRANIQKRAWSTHSRAIIPPKKECAHMCVDLCHFYFFCDCILTQCQLPEWPLTFCGSATGSRWVEGGCKMWQQRIKDGGQSTSPRQRSSSILGGITQKGKQEKFWESQAENNVRASCIKNVAIEKKHVRTEQRPQRPVFGKVSWMQGSPVPVPRGGSTEEDCQVTALEWKEESRERQGKENREQGAKSCANQQASVELRQWRDQPSS